MPLEFEEVGSVSVLQAETGSEVLLEQRGLFDLGEDGRVNVLLVRDTFALDLLLGGFGRAEKLLLGNLLLGLSVAGEVGGSELGAVNTTDVDLGGSGNDVAVVDAAQGNTVNLERTSNKQSAVLESLEENNTLAAETASQDDQNGTGNQAGADFGGCRSFFALLGSGRLSRVPLGCNGGHNSGHDALA